MSTTIRSARTFSIGHLVRAIVDTRFVRFGLVGVSGIGVNMAVTAAALATLPAFTHVDRFSVAIILGIAISIFTNFLLNDRWTWGDRRKPGFTAMSIMILEERGLPADVILVTSAMHMRRAAAVFEKQGFRVHPAPTDFAASTEGAWSVMSFFPSAHHLYLTTRAVHEYFGLFVYWVLGRI